MDRNEEFLRDMRNKIDKLIKKQKRYYFEVENENLREVANYLFNVMGCRLSTATASEAYRGIEVLYHFSHDPSGTYYCPRIVMSNKTNPSMNSISAIVIGAEWIEREMFEMFGIKFIGHPRLEPLLTKDHPKELKQPLRIRRLS